MAATITITTHRDLPAADLLEYTITEALSQIGVAERAADVVDGDLAFDLGCQFLAARNALNAALATLRAQTQPEQARAVAA